jgi:hypothetical protein
MFGTPEDEWLFSYMDRMFERLPIEEGAHLAEQFYGAMPVGVDVEPLKHMLAIRRMRRLLKIDHGKTFRLAHFRPNSALITAAVTGQIKGLQ